MTSKTPKQWRRTTRANFAVFWLLVTAVSTPTTRLQAQAPVVIDQPQNQIVRHGATVNFAVSASGEMSLSFQWQFNGTTLAGATNTSLTLTNVQPSQEGRYSAVVSNHVGIATSVEANLTVCWQVQVTSIDHTFFPSNAAALSDYPFFRFEKFNSEESLLLASGFAAGEVNGVTNYGAGLYKLALGDEFTNVFSYAESAGTNAWLTDFAFDRSGNICAVGVASTNSYLTGERDVLALKFAATGELIWLRRYKSLSSPHSVTVDENGNIYVVGAGELNASTNSVQSDFTVIKFAPDGQRLWLANYPGQLPTLSGSSYVASVAKDECVYVAGRSYSTNYFRDEGLATVKFDRNGKLLWVARFGITYPNGSEPDSLLLDDLGNVYVSGRGYLGAPHDVNATVKYDQNGRQLWAVGHEIDSPRGLPGVSTLDSEGNFYFANHDYGIGQIKLIKYDAEGNRLWSIPIQLAPPIDSLPGKIVVNAAQEILLDGFFYHIGRVEIKLRQNALDGLPTLRTLSRGEQVNRSGRVKSGETVVLEAVATGSPPLKYQWRWNGTNIAGATNSSLILLNIQTTASGNYSILISNPVGCAVSIDVSLTPVDIAPFQLQVVGRDVNTISLELTGQPFWYYSLELSDDLKNWRGWVTTTADSNGLLRASLLKGTTPSLYIRASTFP